MSAVAPPAESGPSRSRGASLALMLTLAALTMIGPFTIDTIFPAFEAIGRDLHADPVAMQQTMSVYLLTFAIASLFHGPISDAVGRRPVILTGVLLYAATSAACALAPNFEVLLVSRGAQGLVAGAGAIVGRTAVRDLFDGVLAQRFMAQISMVFAIAPAVAPIVGGWILGWSQWRTIFWVLAGFGLFLAILAFFVLPETHPASARLPFRPKPLLQAFVGSLLDRRVLLLSLAISLNFGAMFLFISSSPELVMNHLGLGEQDFGYLFVPLVAMMMLGSFLTGRFAGRVRPGVFVLLGFGFSMLGSLFGAIWHAINPPGLPWSIIPSACLGLGVALIFPILTLTLLDTRPSERGSVSSVQGVLSAVTNAIVAGAVSPLVSHSLFVTALTALGFSAFAFGAWALSRRISRVPERGPDCAPAIEPTDQM